jgi:hypothetical protein
MSCNNIDSPFERAENFGREKLKRFIKRTGDIIDFNPSNKPTKTDGIFYSGGCIESMFETKDRNVLSSQYQTLLIEKDKWDELRDKANEDYIDAWYINTFIDDLIFIFRLFFINEPEWKIEWHNVTTAEGKRKKEPKWVGYLNVKDAIRYNIN